MEAKSFDLQPPQEMAALANWFAEGVRAELQALERNGGTQVYEVHSGRLIESKGPNQAIFAFLIADGTRIPEDATGRLKSEDSEFTVSVIGQQGNIIHLHIEYDRGHKIISFLKFKHRLIDIFRILMAA